jgi:hypothetical protein
MLKPNSSNNVTSRVSKSAILAGAALAIPLASKADVIVHTANIPIVSDSTSGDVSYDLNLNPPSDALGDSVNDFQFTASFGNLTDTVTPLGSNGYVGTATNNPTPLDSGNIVGPGSTFQFGTGILQQTTGIAPPLQQGPWPTAFVDKTNGFAYLGVEFNIDGALHYGWVHLSACTPDLFTTCSAGPDPAVITIDSYAYESVANTPITIEPTPEPSFLPLLALGAAGLGAFRARRKKAA